MLQYNKYLHSLGFKIREYGINWEDSIKPRAIVRHFVQRRTCGGCDERVTYNLDSWMIEQVYTWLNMYLEAAYGTIDLEYYKFEFEGEEYTELEAIVYILYHIERRLKFEVNYDGYDIQTEIELDKNVQKALRILAMIWPSLWW